MSKFQHLQGVLGGHAEDVVAHRKAHHGRVPLDLYAALCPIIGLYHAHEVIIKQRHKVWLKLREETDHGWKGQYHLPGTIEVPADCGTSILERLAKECESEISLLDKIQPYPRVIFHDEELRQSRCFSHLYQLELPCPHSFDENWRSFTFREIADISGKYESGAKNLPIIDHHVAMILLATRGAAPDGALGQIDLQKLFRYLPKIY